MTEEMIFNIYSNNGHHLLGTTTLPVTDYQVWANTTPSSVSFKQDGVITVVPVEVPANSSLLGLSLRQNGESIDVPADPETQPQIKTAAEGTYSYYVVTAANYGRLTRNGTKIQVDSAIRDGNGARIDTTYSKKAEEWKVYADFSNEITLSHSLGDVPSSVMVFVKNGDNYDEVYTDVTATTTAITVTFSQSPSYGTGIKIKALI